MSLRKLYHNMSIDGISRWETAADRTADRATTEDDDYACTQDRNNGIAEYINELKKKEEKRNLILLEQRDTAMLSCMGRLINTIAATSCPNQRIARLIELLSIIAYGNIMHIIHSNPFLRYAIIEKCHEIIHTNPDSTGDTAGLCALSHIVLSKLNGAK
jgi:hypothetical protein